MPGARGALALLAIAAANLQGGCAAGPRARPDEMSAPEHQSAAVAANERAASASAEAERGGRAAFHHRATATREATLAAEHAEAASTLLAAERSACEGVPAADIAPSLSGLEVLRVSRLERPVKFREVPEGIGFVFRRAGRSFDSFERLVRCRVARAAVARDGADPLSVPGAHVRVYRDDGDVAVVQIVSREPERAEEIIRRVERSGLARRISTVEGQPTEGLGSVPGRRIPEPSDDPRTHGTDPSRPGPPGVDPIGGGTRPGVRSLRAQ